MLHKYQQHQCNKVSISKKRCYISMLHGNSKHQSNKVSTSIKQHKYPALVVLSPRTRRLGALVMTARTRSKLPCLSN